MLTADIQPTMSVLELGCGTGYFTRELAKTGAKITAIDISPDLIDIAAAGICANNVVIKQENAYQTSFGSGSFDAIVGSSVLHHLEVDKAIQECFRLLKPGGIISFTEPNMMNPQIAVQKNIRCVGRYLGESPNETAFFRWSLKKRIVQAGFENVRIRPFDFLHPKICTFIIPSLNAMGFLFEKTPLIKEFAGSLQIAANKPFLER